MMEYIRLENIAQPVSRLGFGGCPLGGHGWGQVDESDAMDAVRRAWESGVNFFDTADVYGLGRSEELLSAALGSHRKEVVIATKFGVRRTSDGRTVRDVSPGYLRVALEASLRRLRLESLPLYYIHWPDEVTPIEETVAELERCRIAGKIGAIGVSNFTADQLRRASQVAQVSAVQVQYSLVDRMSAEVLRDAADDCHVPLVTWGSLAQGLLTGKFDASSRFEPNDRRSRYVNFQGNKLACNLRAVGELKSIATRLGRTTGQVALRWLLDAPSVGCLLFGAKGPNQVVENVGACGWKLSAEDHQRLDSMNPELAIAAA